MNGVVLSTNVASPQPDPGGAARRSGILKVPCEKIELVIPGLDYGDGSGVVGDFVGDSRHHGGYHKAIYGFNREELNFWEHVLGTSLPSGFFGENLTVAELNLSELMINQRVHIGSALLEVSVPRIPCRTFASWLDVHGWTKKFTERAQCGTYFRIIKPGTIFPGDHLVLSSPPSHGVTVSEAFQAKMGNRVFARRVAAHCLPGHHHAELARLVGEK
ncbi:MOSC domain-containing protein [Corynebacterium poyangense]|uniref:MOSC domain-containing protein n=1 Tax=Corynebacterium poyangense TaxID=2684405 RepID=A0A7H0SNR1_9CORY|nr:MOSC domain-containing protein [Corynebacterium poyangense]QNQ90186.1 MOSC domain-containing protein [Corynebacterium poyangense]